MAVAEDPRRDLDPVADVRFTRIAPAVDLRRRPRWITIRGGRSRRLRKRHIVKSSTVSVGSAEREAARAPRGDPAHIRPRCPAGGSATRPTRSSTGSPRRASPGGRCCRSGRPTSSARRTRHRRRSPRSPGAARRARRARSRGRDRRDCARARPTGSATGSATPARGAVADQVRFDREWSGAARVRARARRAADRRRADLRRRRRRRPSRPSGAVPARRGGRRAAGRVQRDRPALGQSALRLAGAAARGGYRWWVERLRAHARARRPRAHRPLPRLRRLLVGARARPGRARRGTGARGPGRALFERDRRELGGLPADRRGPRRDHAGGGPAARRAGPAGHGGDAVGLRAPPSATSPRARRPPRRTRSSTRARTTRHGARLVRKTWQPSERSGDGARPGPSRAGAWSTSCLGSRARSPIVAAAGRPRPRQRGADEPPRRSARATGRGGSSPGS